MTLILKLFQHPLLFNTERKSLQQPYVYIFTLIADYVNNIILIYSWWQAKTGTSSRYIHTILRCCCTHESFSSISFNEHNAITSQSSCNGDPSSSSNYEGCQSYITLYSYISSHERAWNSYQSSTSPRYILSGKLSEKGENEQPPCYIVFLLDLIVPNYTLSC